ncbi:MAG TPA: hypothetical protein VEF90_09985, partial [Xanthobacteraceae bacterium]|nr:hypothetical protein [Xanthobacteraceae bacterium]
EIAEDLEFAESSPFPQPEVAEKGVYCEGCHEIVPVWQRPTEELLPPKSGVRAEWAAFASKPAAGGNGAPPERRKSALKRKIAGRAARAKPRPKAGR